MKHRIFQARSVRALAAATLIAAALLTAASVSSCSYGPDAAALDAGSAVVSESRGSITIVPSSGTWAATGLMFIPGGLVDPHVYIQALARVSVQSPGYVVVIVKEPANLAILQPGKALTLTDAVSGVSRWAVGGHSLGGVAACMDISRDPAAFAGLVLEASYPAKGNDLSTWTGPVLSISASRDGLATPSKIAAGKPLLPSSTDYQVISGGIHSYFGSYGPQSGDGTPTITRDDQQTQAASLIASFLGGL